MPIGAGSSLHYLVGPVIAFAVLALLALFMRWAFGTGSGRTGRRAAGRGRACSPASPPSRAAESALALRAVLSDAGHPLDRPVPGPHRADVLVFPEDADRARALAASRSRAPE